MVHRWRILAGVAVFAVSAAGCSADSSQIGGADDLPPAVPAGVEFVAPPDGLPMAPEFSATLVDGTSIEMADLWADRPVVLLFTAGWCEHCAELHQELDSVVGDYGDAVALVAIADDTDDEIGTYLEELGVRRPMAVVPIEIWNTYAAKEPPLVALVAPGGVLVRGWPGGVEPDVLGEQLDALTGGADAG